MDINFVDTKLAGFLPKSDYLPRFKKKKNFEIEECEGDKNG